MVARAVTTMNDRGRGVGAASSSNLRTGKHSKSKGNRLSAYERLSRPVRRDRAAFTANPEGSSDVSSSLVSPAQVTHATPRPKSPRAPRPVTWRPDYSAAKFSSAFGEGHAAVERSKSKRSKVKRSRSAPTKKRPITPTQPLFAAQHFQSAVVKVSQDFNPPTPPRPRPPNQPNWNTTDVTISGDSTTSATTPSSMMSSPPRIPNSSSQQRRQRARSPSPQRMKRRSPSPQRKRPSSRNSRDIPVRLETPDETLLAGCLQGGMQGGVLLGKKFAECLHLSFDVYQQECGPHQDRGDDRMFLYRKRTNNSDDDEIVEDDPSSFNSERGSKLTVETDASRSRRGGTSPWSQSRSRSSSPTSSDSKSSSNKTPATPFRSNRSKKRMPRPEEKEDEEKTPTRRTYPRHQDSFDVAPHAIRYDQGEMPRLHKSRGKTPWEESLPDITNEFVELRNVRLSMFQQAAQQGSAPSPQRTRRIMAPTTDPLAIQNSRSDASPEIPEPAEIRRHIRVPGNLTPKSSGPAFPPWRRNLGAGPEMPLTTDDPNGAVRRELEETRQSLRQAREDLKHAQELAERQKADVQTRTSQLASEKVQAETKLQEESRAKVELLKRIGKLQEETAQLKSTLQMAQRDAASQSPHRRPPLSPSLESRASNSRSPTGPSPSRKEQLQARNRAVHSSPDRALADELLDDASPNSSKDEDEASSGKPAGKRAYDSGAVLNLVREVVSGSHGCKPSSAEEGSKSTSPVSVMDVEVNPETETRDAEDSVPSQEKDRESPKEGGAPYLSSRLIALRSELLDVRSKLAEATAARIKAESRRDEVQRMNTEIRRETTKLREDVNELKQLVFNLRSKEGETEEKYEHEVRNIKEELAKVKERADEEEKAKEKLEEELTDTQNEADELREQVAKFMTQLEATKSQSEEKIRVSELEAKNLQEELRQMKLKLAETNSEIVQQAAEHLKKRQEIEAELEQSKETASVLKSRVLLMDDQLSTAETETQQLRSQLSAGGSTGSTGRSPMISTSSGPPEWLVNRQTSLSPTAAALKKSFAGMAESITRSLSDGMVEGPIIIPEAPPKEARSSVMERLRNTLDPSHGKIS